MLYVQFQFYPRESSGAHNYPTTLLAAPEKIFCEQEFTQNTKNQIYKSQVFCFCTVQNKDAKLD